MIKLNESNKYYKLDKYNNIITKVIYDKNNYSVGSRINNALKNLYKNKVINGYTSSPGRYQVQHPNTLTLDKLDKLISDYLDY